MKKILCAVAFVGALLCLSGCGSGSSSVGSSAAASQSAASNTGAGSSVSLEALRSAPTKAVVGAKTYALNATLYRDYMPTVSVDGSTPTHPLTASFTVASTDGSAVQAGMTVTSAWVVQLSTMDSFTNLSPNISSTINAVSTLAVPSDSTNFAPGSAVEVVVQVRGADGTTYLLQDPSVTISAAL